MQLVPKAFAVGASSLVFSLTIGVLVLNLGCSESTSSPTSVNKKEIADYKASLREFKAEKKAIDQAARKKRRKPGGP